MFSIFSALIINNLKIICDVKQLTVYAEGKTECYAGRHIQTFSQSRPIYFLVIT